MTNAARFPRTDPRGPNRARSARSPGTWPAVALLPSITPDHMSGLSDALGGIGSDIGLGRVVHVPVGLIEHPAGERRRGSRGRYAERQVAREADAEGLEIDRQGAVQEGALKALSPMTAGQ
jgi:hypothetical protein